MAIPGWVYLRSSDSGHTPKIKWGTFEDNVEKIVDASGGFKECSTSEVVRYLRQLCENSMEKWTEKDSVIIERASSTVVFSCEVRNDATFVQWRMEISNEGDIKCQPGVHRQAMQAEPAFVFDKKGELEAIEFWARNGQRQSVNAANCRRKAQLTLSRKLKTDTQESVDRMPRLKSDPEDYVMANRMCFAYDVAADWSSMRGSIASGE